MVSDELGPSASEDDNSGTLKNRFPLADSERDADAEEEATHSQHTRSKQLQKEVAEDQEAEKTTYIIQEEDLYGMGADADASLPFSALGSSLTLGPRKTGDSDFGSSLSLEPKPPESRGDGRGSPDLKTRDSRGARNRKSIANFVNSAAIVSRADKSDRSYGHSLSGGVDKSGRTSGGTGDRRTSVMLRQGSGGALGTTSQTGSQKPRQSILLPGTGPRQSVQTTSQQFRVGMTSQINRENQGSNQTPTKQRKTLMWDLETVAHEIEESDESSSEEDGEHGTGSTSSALRRGTTTASLFTGGLTRASTFITNAKAEATNKAQDLVKKMGLKEDNLLKSTENLSQRRKRAIRIVKSTRFESCTGFLVLMNSLTMGLESELIPPDAELCTLNDIRTVIPRCRTEAAFYYVDYFFLLVFTGEMAFRVYAFRSKAIFSWQGMFDGVIVVSGWITEVFIPLIFFAASPDLSSLQTLKMLRVLRAVRVLRMAAIFRDLYFVVQAFFRTLRPLFWVMLFVLIIIFLFAMLSINIIGRNAQFNGVVDDDGVDIQGRFKYTIQAMVVLFQIMTMDEWYNILNPLFQRGPWTYFFFLTYIAISALVLMNLVTAVVVDTSVKSAKKENQDELQKQLFEKKVGQMAEDIADIFERFDTDNSGYLDCEEFVEIAPSVHFLQNFCQIFGLETEEDFEELFFMISGDDDKVSIEEFVEAVTKFQQATADQTVIAVFRTATSRDERLKQVAKIVETRPGMVDTLKSVQEDYDITGRNLSELSQRFRMFDTEVEQTFTSIRSEFITMKAALEKKTNGTEYEAWAEAQRLAEEEAEQSTPSVAVGVGKQDNSRTVLKMGKQFQKERTVDKTPFQKERTVDKTPFQKERTADKTPFQKEGTDKKKGDGEGSQTLMKRGAVAVAAGLRFAASASEKGKPN